MIVITIDPVTGNRDTELEHHPFVEDNRHACLMAQPNDPDLFEDDFTHHS